MCPEGRPPPVAERRGLLPEFQKPRNLFNMTKTTNHSRAFKSSRHKLLSLTPEKKTTGNIKSAINVNNTAQEYIVYVAVPGMERKDFAVRIDKRRLIVSAAKNEALHCFSLSDEQAHPTWKETFTLPDDADTVMTAAVYKNGELEIHIPKGRCSEDKLPVDVFVY
ncbi:MAG: Hsp20/alpha crystallin family protein [Bacteroidetes bacterium]|nr:Hsp20/alpha crystallin family protein [Bacteroidota bacterium]